MSEDQSDPFIVTRPDNPDDHLIVTVSPRYLVEKDINGVIQDKLDLQVRIIGFFSTAGHKEGESLAKFETAVSIFKLGFSGSTDIQFYETG